MNWRPPRHAARPADAARCAGAERWPRRCWRNPRWAGASRHGDVRSAPAGGPWRVCSPSRPAWVSRWRTQARLFEARRRLAEGRSVTEVAHALGYASDSAFIAMYRRVCGQSPGAPCVASNERSEAFVGRGAGAIRRAVAWPATAPPMRRRRMLHFQPLAFAHGAQLAGQHVFEGEAQVAFVLPADLARR